MGEWILDWCMDSVERESERYCLEDKEVAG